MLSMISGIVLNTYLWHIFCMQLECGVEVLAVSIHEIDGHFIHIFKRTSHDNKYVKIVKNSVLGKYILTGKKKLRS